MFRADETKTRDDTHDDAPLEAAPQLFLLLESARPLAPSARIGLEDVETVVIGRGAERTIERVHERGAKHVRVTIPDRWMSSSHVRIWKLHGRWVVEDERSKNGTKLNGTPATRGILEDGDLIELGQTFFLFRDRAPTSREDPAILDAALLAPPVPELATFSAPLRRGLADVAQAARSGVSVVILGESGTGKEVVARALHDLSGRPGAFVAVNCGALPDTLVEVELFGAKRGAYSGASEDRAGLVRAADRGTLFLDEIGDLPEPSQVAFLRVLQEREVVAIGDTRPVKVDFRLVAATHRDLEALAESGRFRRDLYARISGLTLSLPPLRDRMEDLGILIGSLLVRVAGSEEDAAKLTLSPKAARTMLQHGWPLNVRELEKCLETAVALVREGTIEAEHLPPAVRAPPGRDVSRAGEEAGDEEPHVPGPLSPEDERIKESLVALLGEHAGNISAVSRAMGKARMQVHRWIRRFEIDLDQFRR